MNPAFVDFLLEQNVAGYKPEGITLKSGKISHWYANCRVLSQTQTTLTATSVFVAHFLKENNLLNGIDAIFGVPEGAAPLGHAVTSACIAEGLLPNDTLYFFRGKAKEHGDPANRFWVNGNVPKTALVIEDVTTTGGSALAFVQKLRDAGVTVQHIVGLINRQQLHEGKTVAEHCTALQCAYHPLTDASALLPRIIERADVAVRALMQKQLSEEYTEEYAPQPAPFAL